jgi:hypothetical protein
MQSNVARSAPGAQVPSIYAFVYDFTCAAEALGLARGWHLDTIPGTPAEPCMVVKPAQPTGLDAIRGHLLARGFAVGSDPEAPGVLFVAMPHVVEPCPACAQGTRCVRHSPLKGDDPSDLVAPAACEVIS